MMCHITTYNYYITDVDLSLVGHSIVFILKNINFLIRHHWNTQTRIFETPLFPLIIYLLNDLFSVDTVVS